MLFKETVSKSTLELLITLMKDKALSDFILVGGTALALQLGHRISIDLDLFSVSSFDQDKLADHLRSNYNFILDFISENTIKGEIQEIQVDFISHQYPLLEKKEYEDIRLASLIDIAAMKLNAIAGNGTRLKDFIDIAYLSASFSLSQMLEGYGRKYSSNSVMPLKAIVYYDDINFAEPIKMVSKNKFKWKLIEQRLQLMHKNPHEVFDEL